MNETLYHHLVEIYHSTHNIIRPFLLSELEDLVFKEKMKKVFYEEWLLGFDLLPLMPTSKYTLTGRRGINTI